ncbi:MFS transporter [Neobacillus mesonae]|nr:MFS transporter [Neobacillus mesonae]
MSTIVQKTQPAKGSTDPNAKLSFLEKFGYGMGDFTTSVVFTAISVYLSFFYTDIIGLSAAAVGTLMLITRVADAFFDIGVGVLVDKTKSKHGKARPWMLWIGAPFGIATILLFFVPDLGPTGTLIYAYVTYLLVNIFYSAINIPYGVMNAMITQEPYQRTLLNIFRMFLAFVGAAIITYIAMPMIDAFGGGRTGYAITFGIFGVVAPFLYLFTFLTTKERVKPTVVQKEIPFNRGIKALFRNKYWIILVFLSIIMYASNAITNGLNVYYAKYLFGDEALVGTLGLAGLLPLLVALPISTPLIKKFGKRNAALAGLILSIAGYVLIWIAPDNFGMVLAGLILKTFAIGPLAGTTNAMLADTIDYGEWKTGARTEGLVYSASSFGMKVGTGLGGAAIGWALALASYDGKLAVQPDSAIAAIKGMYIFVPLVLTLIQIVLLAMYTLDKKHRRIMDELNSMSSNN